MKTPIKILIVAALAATVVAAVVLKPAKNGTRDSAEGEASGPLPRLVDLGADKCIPCKMMAPVLEELKKEYAGRLRVDFIDVWKAPEAGKPYGIEVIPTQIFFDAGGKELFRHVGFFAKEEILAKWKELGIDLSARPSAVVNGPGRVVAYYFHKTVRCETCQLTEAQARVAIEQRFAAELGAGRLKFTLVNYELPENAHFQADYKLTCPSLVLVREQSLKEPKSQLLGETWNLVGDPPKFGRYVETEVEKFLADAK